jgi:CheY-like chemotaxis protein
MPRVLLAHANADDREMYAEYLRSNRFDVAEVASTDAALELMTRCDVLVTGLLVPGSFDGIELIDRVKQDPLTRNTPVIVVTACVVKDMQDAAKHAGCDALLLKPCFPDALLREVLRVTATRTRTGGAPS